MHVHYVVEPVTAVQLEASGLYGPRLHVEMFRRGEPPAHDDLVEVCQRERQHFDRVDT